MRYAPVSRPGLRRGAVAQSAYQTQWPNSKLLMSISRDAQDQKVEGSNPSSPANISSRQTKLQSGLVLGDGLPRTAANLLVKGAAVSKPPTLCNPRIFHAVEDHLGKPDLLASRREVEVRAGMSACEAHVLSHEVAVCQLLKVFDLLLGESDGVQPSNLRQVGRARRPAARLVHQPAVGEASHEAFRIANRIGLHEPAGDFHVLRWAHSGDSSRAECGT